MKKLEPYGLEVEEESDEQLFSLLNHSRLKWTAWCERMAIEQFEEGEPCTR